MTILKLKNPTNIYRIDLGKKTRRERGYLALEDLRIKSKFSRSNMPIREVGRSGERKNPSGRRKKRKKARTERLGAGLKHYIGAIDLGTVLDANNHDAKFGVKLGAKIYGAKVPAKSPPRLRQDQDLCAKIYGAETCKLGAINNGAELKVQILKAYRQRHIYEKLSKNKD